MARTAIAMVIKYIRLKLAIDAPNIGDGFHILNKQNLSTKKFTKRVSAHRKKALGYIAE
jgi:hypothetical protein